MTNLSIFRVPEYVLVLILFAAPGWGQSKPEQQQQAQGEDVVRVNTELVQTDVMVFDKKGHFVDGLKPEQFVLRIDNKPQTISFFERVACGAREQSSAQTKAPANPETPITTSPSSLVRGRTLIFFADDLHLAPGSLVR